jgi:fatty acid desaturase
MVFKTVFMLLLFFTPLAGIIFFPISSVPLLFGLFILSGFGMAGIGMGVMHDAIHGSYSKNKIVNKLMGYTINLIGANDKVWKLQHNVLHHSFTNVDEHDDDINAPFISISISMPGSSMACQRYHGLPLKILFVTPGIIKWALLRTEKHLLREYWKL